MSFYLNSYDKPKTSNFPAVSRRIAFQQVSLQKTLCNKRDYGLLLCLTATSTSATTRANTGLKTKKGMLFVS